jgi:surface protein
MYQLTMACETPGAAIWYAVTTAESRAATDPGIPTWTKYTAPLTLTSDCTVKAYAERPNGIRSAETEYTFKMSDVMKVETPTLAWSGDTLTVSTATEGAQIVSRLYLPGETTHAEETGGTTPIKFRVEVDCNLEIYAYKEGMLTSDTLRFYYPHDAWVSLTDAIATAQATASEAATSDRVTAEQRNSLNALITTAQLLYDERTAVADTITAKTTELNNATEAIRALLDAVEEAYAVLEGTTVTFYYDTKKTERGGMDINNSEITSGSGSPYGAATTAVFDASFADYRPTSTAYWFMSCSSLTAITGMENLKTDSVTSMAGMFWRCSSLTSLDVSGFKTDKVENMACMFTDCSGLTSLNVSSFNTANVTDMSSMFSYCSGLTGFDVSGFKTDNVKDMGWMFSNISGLTSLDVSGFNTSNVTHMAGMFNGCISLPVLDISSFNTAKVTDMGDIFVDCRSLASIVAGSADVPDEEYAKVENPNLLVYVDDASLAPAGIQNVVIGDVAKEIVLVDVTSGNNNFYVPKAFTTEKISYSHNFTQQTTPGVSRGWESLVLPFTVQTITHETHGELKPFKAMEGDKPFWLRTLTASGIKSAVRIVANMPYLISMPNNADAYDDEYNQGGVVTFASASVTVPATKLTVAALSDSSIVMRPTLQRVPQSETVYALNIGEPRGSYAEGSVFERDYRVVRPFECYTTHKSGTGGSRFITLGDLNSGDGTGIQNLTLTLSEDEGAIYDLGGRRVDRPMVNGQRSKVKGVYIQRGRKHVVR